MFVFLAQDKYFQFLNYIFEVSLPNQTLLPIFLILFVFLTYLFFSDFFHLIILAE